MSGLFGGSVPPYSTDKANPDDESELERRRVLDDSLSRRMGLQPTLVTREPTDETWGESTRRRGLQDAFDPARAESDEAGSTDAWSSVGNRDRKADAGASSDWGEGERRRGFEPAYRAIGPGETAARRNAPRIASGSYGAHREREAASEPPGDIAQYTRSPLVPPPNTDLEAYGRRGRTEIARALTRIPPAAFRDPAPMSTEQPDSQVYQDRSVRGWPAPTPLPTAQEEPREPTIDRAALQRTFSEVSGALPSPQSPDSQHFQEDFKSGFYRPDPQLEEKRPPAFEDSEAERYQSKWKAFDTEDRYRWGYPELPSRRTEQDSYERALGVKAGEGPTFVERETREWRKLNKELDRIRSLRDHSAHPEQYEQTILSLEQRIASIDERLDLHAKVSAALGVVPTDVALHMVDELRKKVVTSHLLKQILGRVSIFLQAAIAEVEFQGNYHKNREEIERLKRLDEND